MRGDEPLLQVDSAFVAQEANGTGWTIGNELIRYSLTRQGGTVVVRALEDVTTGRDWHRRNAPDSFLTLNGQRVDIGSASTVFQRASVTESWGGARLDLFYRIASVPLEITRSYACYPGSSVIETWTTVRASGAKSATLSDLTNFAFTVGNGNLHSIGGLDVPDTAGGPFTFGSRDLTDGQVVEIGGEWRATERNLPWFGVSAWTSEDEAAQLESVRDATQFFGSLLWSGAWRARVGREGDNLAVQLGLSSFNITLAAGASIETPHAVFGMTNPDLPTASLAMQNYVRLGVRHGRPFRPLVTYNTWFSYGTFVDEGSIRAEMDLAAQMGFERFVIDAGWWSGINGADASDYVHGWGNWEVDAERFPNGLGALTDYAHERGMRFGVWVEPERVDRVTVGRPGLAKERFLATRDGRYDPSMPNAQSESAQVCLADSEAQAWVLGKLHAFLDAVHPDYLKWDNNFWINCNRPTHGHGAEDGNFRHTRGLQDVFADLRASYPEMNIENCAGGGRRLSLDLLAYTDTAWVDDRSSPSGRVRHNLEGLSYLFPPAYLFSFAIADENEPMAEDPPLSDLPALLRSRMLGVLGGTWVAGEMSEGTRAVISRQFALYKLIRPILQESGSVLLQPQRPGDPAASWSGWDAIEHLAPRTGDAVVLAFHTPDSPPSVVLKPKGLRANASYEVESADYGPLGTATGADLMERGLQVDASSVTRSHVLIFRIHHDE